MHSRTKAGHFLLTWIRWLKCLLWVQLLGASFNSNCASTWKHPLILREWATNCEKQKQKIWDKKRGNETHVCIGAVQIVFVKTIVGSFMCFVKCYRSFSSHKLSMVARLKLLHLVTTKNARIQLCINRLFECWE